MAMTAQMLEHARQEQWEELVALYRRRDPLLRAFFDTLEPTLEAEFLQKAIPELMEMDQQLMAVCAVARNEAARQLGQVSVGRKAEAAYNQYR